MLFLITIIETVYPGPTAREDEEGTYCPDGEATVFEDSVTFRELVEQLKAYNWLSSTRRMAADCGINDWAIAEAEQDYRTGEFMERTLHYHRNNPPSALKYWQKALRYAGLVN